MILKIIAVMLKNVPHFLKVCMHTVVQESVQGADYVFSEKNVYKIRKLK